MVTILVVFVDGLEYVSHGPAADVDAIVLEDLAITCEVGEERHG